MPFNCSSNVVFVECQTIQNDSITKYVKWKLRRNAIPRESKYIYTDSINLHSLWFSTILWIQVFVPKIIRYRTHLPAKVELEYLWWENLIRRAIELIFSFHLSLSLFFISMAVILRIFRSEFNLMSWLQFACDYRKKWNLLPVRIRKLNFNLQWRWK